MKGIQDLNLASGCIDNGRIQHEFLHAIGIQHHQSRSDRDQYVNIHLENVKDKDENGRKTEKYKENFDMYSVNQVSHYGLGYDYLSVMHYARKDFSKNNKDTITAKDSLFTNKIGQREGASLRDVQLVQRHYGCPGTVTNIKATIFIL